MRGFLLVNKKHSNNHGEFFQNSRLRHQLIILQYLLNLQWMWEVTNRICQNNLFIGARNQPRCLRLRLSSQAILGLIVHKEQEVRNQRKRNSNVITRNWLKVWRWMEIMVIRSQGQQNKIGCNILNKKKTISERPVTPEKWLNQPSVMHVLVSVT